MGKSVRWASRLLHHGGSAFPGKVVERFDPTFLSRTLSTLPLGVVLVSGTNGKTTTTRMVATMLESLGLKVFTNPTGSNFTRGVVSSILTEVPLNGRLTPTSPCSNSTRPTPCTSWSRCSHAMRCCSM